ncbi:MAG: Argininosuccinate lyase [Alphaproteobacteria bacterium MarineAlpha5_Bin8]|nr:MAG: Argininosuccinate lyase [Alphaproteobacteria bacterium MarineAlpha5_Bin7]PPR47178.1 MAG: Argininosuccinate lyase [Alphaproteobacteria bacterium MarineAlpha5_Bin8]PPR53602.1 MAG: Argininosuccinate lyase [Alphaproteobacteria bacterium MarineAlpha5_Bin6]|tara:strand:- start:1 stop:1383 length:1383 start_codon:yes stop_codon:yes gene_type:complete
MKKNPARNANLKKNASQLLEKINSSIDVDSRLYSEDIEASIAHCKMLIKTKIISLKNGNKIINGLNKIQKDISKNKIKFNSKYEDIHMNIEAILYDNIGSVAGMLHTGRSRNDQVVTDFKLWIKSNSKNIENQIKKLQKALISIAKKNVLTVMPGYTHMQIAQPISLAHHCLAYVEMLGRDRQRITNCISLLNENPLGAGALAGTAFPIDRKFTTKLLGFKNPTVNSVDSVSDRDFAIEFIFTLTMIAMHLSRLAEEIILWSSQHFNFIKLPDQLSTGSSIMPQKKNPDGAEIVRSNVASLIGNLNSIMITLKGLPLAYSKDLQNDKKITFESYDDVLLSAKVMTEILNNIQINKKIMHNSIYNSYSTATDLADWLVKNLDFTFRDAYNLTGKIVNYASKKDRLLDKISIKEFQKFDKNITKEVFKVLSPLNSMKSKSSFGGTSPETVKKSIQYAIKKYL